MEKLFLVDAYALIYRNYFAFMGRPMRNRAGMNTSAIFGFAKFLRDTIHRERPRYLGVAFDPRGGSFRSTLYPAYKANRQETPEDIIAAVPYIKRILEAMRIPILEVPGYEADDVIGTLAGKAADAGFRVYMVTPDKDFGQLVRPTVFIYKQRSSGEGIEILGPDEICARYGIPDPRLVIDILALWGDASDNIPGVPGIGEKSACKLVGTYGTVEQVIAHIDQLKGRQRENLMASTEQLTLSKRLATIALDVPIDFDPEQLRMENPDCDALREIYRELDFNYFLREMDTDCNSPFRRATVYDDAVGPGAGSAAGLHAGPAPERHPGEPAASAPDDRLQRDLFGSPMAGTPAHRPSGSATPPHAAARRQAAAPAPGDSAPGDSATGTPGPDSPAPDSSAPSDDLFATAPALDNLRTVPHSYRIVDDETQLMALVRQLAAAGEFAFDTETTGLDPLRDRPVGISFAIRPGEAFYVPLDPQRADATLALLKPLFEDANLRKVGQNLKFDLMVLRAQGIAVRGPLFDTMILHYLLDPESRHGLDHLARTLLGYDPIELESLIGRGAKQLSFDRVPLEQAAEYAAEDADLALRLKQLLWPRIEQTGMTDLYRRIEEPLITTLLEMEMTGVRIDPDFLGRYAVTLEAELAELESRIRELAEAPQLNIGSARQLGEVLFDRLRIDPKPRRTRTGQYRTDEEYLTQLADRHAIVRLVLEWRGVKKLLSTYVDALPRLINPVTGRLHTSYNQAVTATGRLSSTDPNLQNIPVRDERGRQIRRAFVPAPGRILLSADYSQVELRLMAHLSGDQALIEAFRHGADIHAATAARLFGVPLDEVTPDQRRKAKTANFGIIYGISAFGLKQRIADVSLAEAREIIEGYFASYPGVRAYIDRVTAEARERGYVETIFGRRRYLPDINSRNANARGLAERNAVNAPIQGSAADIIKIAMNRVQAEFHARGLAARTILQVHDELVVELPPDEEAVVRTVVREAMEGAARLSVDLTVEIGTGDNWLEAH